jgi:nitrite reductase (NADH) small subunit
MRIDADPAWLRICSRDDIPVLGARVVRRVGRADIALFRTRDDQVFALLDRCPHRGGPLSQGIVHGRSVTCPLHGWNIGLDDGQAAAPDVGCTRVFQLRIEVREREGDVYLRRDEVLEAELLPALACSA